MRLRDGERWNKVFGPVFMYLNSDSDSTSIWEDAKRQVNFPPQTLQSKNIRFFICFLRNRLPKRPRIGLTIFHCPEIFPIPTNEALSQADYLSKTGQLHQQFQHMWDWPNLEMLDLGRPTLTLYIYTRLTEIYRLALLKFINITGLSILEPKRQKGPLQHQRC